MLVGSLFDLNIFKNCKNSMSITYKLSNAGEIKINIYNGSGKNIITLLDKNQTAGIHSIMWDGNDNLGSKIISGIYFIRFESNTSIITRKIVLTQ